MATDTHSFAKSLVESKLKDPSENPIIDEALSRPISKQRAQLINKMKYHAPGAFHKTYKVTTTDGQTHTVTSKSEDEVRQKIKNIKEIKALG